MAPRDTGMGTQFQMPRVNAIVIAVFLGIAIYNVLELIVLIQTFFKRHSGLYYFSLLVSTFGIFFHALSNLLKFYELNNSMPGYTIANTIVAWISWVAMVTGQSVVLWSRLHLVVQSLWTRWVLVIIIVNALILHTSTGVLTFLTNISQDPGRWKGPYSIIERTQVTLFFLQEVLISSIYLWKTAVMLRSEGPLFDANRNVRGKGSKRVLVYTIAMSVIIICLDVTLIALEFSGCELLLPAFFDTASMFQPRHRERLAIPCAISSFLSANQLSFRYILTIVLLVYDIQTSYKDAVYSVKLKIEFTILNQLMDLVNGNLRENNLSQHTYSSPRPNTHGTAKIADSAICSTTRYYTTTRPGYPTGAYTRMDDKISACTGIKLQSLKSTDVLKTTTTEVRVDKIEKTMEAGECKERLSVTLSGVYITS